MSDLNRLEIALLVKHALKNGGALDDHLSKYLTKQGIPLTVEEITTYTDSRIVNLLAEVDYLVNHTKVSGGMITLIEEVTDQIVNDRDINKAVFSSKVCAIGNQGSTLNNQGIEGALRLKNIIQNLLAKLSNFSNLNSELIVTYCNRLRNTFNVLNVLHNFTVSYENMLAGDKPYTEDQVENAILATGYDFSPVNKASSTLDDSIKVVEGLEDYLNNNTGTEAYAYVEGIAIANSIYNVTGSEGPAFEKIKEIGRKGLEVVRASFDSLMKKITPKDNEERFENLVAKAENNKKLLQKVDNQQAKVKTKAKEGLITLCKATQEDNELVSIASSLNNVSQGMATIDRFLGEGRKVLAGQTSGLTKLINDTRSDIKKLESAISNSTKGDEENKDVVADNKEAVTNQLAETKASLKKLREEEQKTGNRIKGITKIVTNISPKIFNLEEDKEGEGSND